MKERGEAGPRPNPQLKEMIDRNPAAKDNQYDVGYVNGVPYILWSSTSEIVETTKSRPTGA